MNQKSVIFDLDGTLIDSAPSILETLCIALEDNSVKPIIYPNRLMIGPPVFEIISSICPEVTVEVKMNILSSFSELYDCSGYKNSIVYSGVNIMLQSLLDADIKLFLATNKRNIATLKIVEYFGWEKTFNNIYTLDMYKPAYVDKQQMLTALINECSLNAERSLYVGDRNDDGVASLNNGIDFIYACWGYGDSMFDMWNQASHPDDIVNYVKNK